MHAAFNRLGEAIGAYQSEDSTTWVLPVGSDYGCLTVGDLRAVWEQVGVLLAEVKDLKTAAAELAPPTCTSRTHYFPPRIPGEVTYTCYCGNTDAGTVVTFAEIASDEDAQREAEQAAETDKARGIDEGIQTWVSDGWN